MEIVTFGFDAKAIEHELREQLDITSGKFESDILQMNERGEPESGLAYELAIAGDREEALNALKRSLLDQGDSLGGHFRNFLQRKRENTPGFVDQLICWFPEDDLKIEYSRSGKALTGAQSHRARKGSGRPPY